MSQQNVPEWMPLYVYEFIADRDVQAMELDELGAYFRLILTQWVNGSVPADRRALARLLHCEVEKMERIWVALAPCYKEHPERPGELIQGRVEGEREAAMARLAGNVKGGVVSASRRRSKTYGPAPAPIAPDVPVETPHAEPTRVRDTGIMERWEEFKRLYPAHRLDEEIACRAILSREEEAADIVAGLKVAVLCEAWQKDNGKFVPKASNFISTGQYKDHLRAAPAPKKPVPYFDPRSITG